MEREFLTVEDLAGYLKVPRSWIYNRTRNNTIPYLRVGKYVRFVLKDVIEALEKETGNADLHRLRKDTVEIVGKEKAIPVQELRAHQ